MPSIRVSDYVFFLKTFHLGHQLFRIYYAKMQGILAEFPFKLVEQEGFWLCPRPSLSALVSEALSMNQGMLGVLEDRLAQQQTKPEDALMPVCDYYLILNDQQNYHAFLVKRGVQMEQAIGILGSFYRFNPHINGASFIESFKRLHQEALSTHQDMSNFLKNMQVHLTEISLQKGILGTSFAALMQHLKKDRSLSKACDTKDISQGSADSSDADSPLSDKGDC